MSNNIDKRGREWEMFVDVSYYYMYCVRVKEDRDFNSSTSFHFNTEKEAQEFLSLVIKSH